MTTMTAAQLRAQTAPMDQVPDPQVPQRPRPPRQYPAAYKLRILEEYKRLDKKGKGALPRREGLPVGDIGGEGLGDSASDLERRLSAESVDGHG